MKNLFHPFLCCSLFIASVASAQDESFRQGIHKELASQMEIYRVPEKGSFVTLRVATFDPFYLRYDPNMMIRFVLLKPVYYLVDDMGVGFFSVGCFSTVEEGRKFREQLRPIFEGVYPVAFKNGVHVSLNDYESGNQPVQYPDFKKAIKSLKKLMNMGYYRVQFGYYEKTGLEPNEQEMYDKLEEAGIDIIEEGYEAGRRYVTKKQYPTYKEAHGERERIGKIVGRYFTLADYGKPTYVLNDYLQVLYDQLRTIK